MHDSKSVPRLSYHVSGMDHLRITFHVLDDTERRIMAKGRNLWNRLRDELFLGQQVLQVD